MHWLEKAYIEGMRSLDMKELMRGTIEHNSVEGVWERGVISPSLVNTQCRLSRLKKFMGLDPQPGMKAMGVRAGVLDPVSHLNFLRGFFMEGIIVTALKHSLPGQIIGNAPTLLFRWVDPSTKVVYSGHPDVLIANPKGGLELVQIKSPSIWKLERIAGLAKKKGPQAGAEDALESYRGQMATEIFMGRQMDMPIERINLMLASWEGTPRMSKTACEVITLEWHPSLSIIPLEIGREVVKDFKRVQKTGVWPEAEPEHKWDSWPCSYCQYSRLGTFDLIGCTEHQEWERYAETGLTRVTAEPDEGVIPLRRRRRAG